MRLLLAALILCLSATPLVAQPDFSASPEAMAEDVASVDALIEALYGAISGAQDQARDWDRMRSLFYPGARLIPTGQRQQGDQAAFVWTVDEYIEQAEPFLLRDGFWETEIGRTTEAFGSIVHAFSTYESRVTTPDSDPVMRGINSIQLFHDGTRWWIVSVFWANERPDLPLPEAYRSGIN